MANLSKEEHVALELMKEFMSKHSIEELTEKQISDFYYKAGEIVREWSRIERFEWSRR